MSKDNKPKPPTPAEYEKAEIDLALSIMTIRPCRQCKWPVLHGYCCGHCGSSSP